MKRVLLSVAFMLSAAFAVATPSIGAEGGHSVLEGGANIVTKFISREYGGELDDDSTAKRLQGFQVDTRLFQGEHWVFVTETAYSQGSRNSLKTWVFDTAAKAVAYKQVTPHAKLFIAPTMGIVTSRVRTETDRNKRETELSWGGEAGAEFSQGRLSLLLSGSYRSIEELSDGMAVDGVVNIALSSKVFLTAGIGYDWGPHAVRFQTGIGLRPNGFRD